MGGTSFIERYSIKKQLSITFIMMMALSIGMTVLTLGAGGYWLYAADFLRPANHYEQEIPIIEAYVKQHGEELLNVSARDALEQVISLGGIQYQIMDVRGAFKYGSIEMPLISNNEALIEKINTTTISDASLGIGGVITKVIPITAAEGQWRGAMLLQYKMEVSSSSKASRLLLVLVICLLFASPFMYIALFTWLFATKLGKRMNKPISELIHAAKRIQKQDLDFSISYAANNEIGILSQSFESMRQELKNALLREWKMEQERRDMMDAIAHDFRTPMMIIQGNVELLTEVTELTQERLHNHLRVIEHNVRRVNRLFQDIQVVSGKDLEYFPFGLEKVDLPTFIDMKEHEIRYLCASKQVGFKFSIEERRRLQDSPIYMDMQRIGQVLDNIISNSLRFVPAHGEIDGRVILYDGLIQFEICDTGPGFDLKDIPFLFQKFYRGEKGQSGLGLYTASIIVEKHGGKIEAYNRAEGGACLVFTMQTTLQS
ncbi:HAMP domain-containing histidine kinase [Paenibacillus sp. SYP-B3998]|uniref:histidine kinase n=1 Tax=Paenibacillus sp. SYP-B3998 TaxID=2678564 RepID=A0A6G3ZRF9_9BACL|nr:HAMP domain-containing sensor histidine kinase [Paenibacillus sp. SYP-B3998]NEW04793.1 HAMP domain-containing histidine kinase [Paenibacillus sp. SYP-B3998]